MVCLEKVKDNWLCSRALTCTLNAYSQRQHDELRPIFGQGKVTLAENHRTVGRRNTTSHLWLHLLRTAQWLQKKHFVESKQQDQVVFFF